MNKTKKNYLLYPTNRTLSLDKPNKKSYTESGVINKNIFDDDTLANSALDYLYSYGNRNKTQTFLKNNGLPSFEEREYNKSYYGAEEEGKRILDLFKKKTSSILKPELPNDTDRAFLTGLLGKEEEERNYQKRITSTNRALSELQNAFRGSQFEGKLDPPIQKNIPSPSANNLVNRTSQNEIEYDILGLNKKYDTTRYFEKIKEFLNIKDSEYKEKIKENAKQNDESEWNTRRSSDIISKNADSIKNAGKKYGVNPAIIAACIYSEQMLNYNATDLIADKLYWRNPSIGIGQVQIETAKRIEENTNIEKIEYLGKKQDWHGNSYTEKDAWLVPGYGVFLGTKEQAISKRLNNDQQCVEYAAAYLKLIQDLWKKEYPVISGDSGVLATLYNGGEYGSKGINSSPKPSPFGEFAKANYKHMQYLLGIEEEETK